MLYGKWWQHPSWTMRLLDDEPHYLPSRLDTLRTQILAQRAAREEQARSEPLPDGWCCQPEIYGQVCPFCGSHNRLP
jgi:hypothetical protein